MKRNPTMVIGVTLLLAVAAWLFGWYLPQGGAIDAHKAERVTAESELSRLTNELKRLSVLARDDVKQRARLERLAAMVPVAVDLDDLIEEFQQVADESGLAWLAITPNTVPANEGVAKPTNITMSLRGRFQPVLDYLRGIASMERLVIVDGVTLGGADDGTSSTETTLEFSAPRITSSIDPELSFTITTRVFSGGADVTAILAADADSSAEGAADGRQSAAPEPPPEGA